MHETTQGIYDALLRGRFAFDYVHEDRLEPERLKKYRALLLPNVAMLSDRQCEQLRDYVRAGGSLMAGFETSLYDENLEAAGRFRPCRPVRRQQGRRCGRHQRQSVLRAH